MTDAPAPPRRPGPVAVVVALGLTLLVVAGVIAAVGPSGIVDPTSWATDDTAAVAVLTVLLLAADVVLPIPSSVVLVANGALFGWAVGTLVSSVGLSVGGLVAYGLGRGGTGLVGRVVDAADAARARTLVAAHGPWVVAASRPVPILAEVAAIVAGATGMPAGRFTLACVVGSVAFAAPLAALGDGLVGGGTGAWIAAGALASGVALAVGARTRRRPA